MDLGFSDIIGQGIRNTDAARQQTFNDFAKSIGGFVQRNRQNDFNSKYQATLNRLGILDTNPEEGTPKERAELEAKKRNLAIIGNLQGYPGALQALQHEDELALQREKMEYARKAAEEEARLKEQEEIEKRKQQVLDGFKEPDLLQFDAIKEFNANNSLLPETREQLINAIAREEGVKNDEARQRLLGELSKEKADALRLKVEKIAEIEGMEFKRALKNVTGGNFSDLPKLLAAIPAVMAQGWAGKDSNSAIRIKNAIDTAFDNALDPHLIERAYRRYTPEQMQVGLERSRTREYRSQAGTAEEFDG